MPPPATIKLASREWFRRESQAVTVEPRTPQARFPIHDHEFGEIVIVMSGNGWHILNDEPQLITCGEVFYIRPEDQHGFEQVNDLVLTNVIYRPSERLLRVEWIREFVETGGPFGRRRWQVSEDALPRVRVLLDQLAREVRSDDPLSDLMAEILFMQLAVVLCRYRFPIEGDNIPGSGKLGQLLSYLRTHCVEDVDLDRLATRFGYSPRTFSRVFRTATSTTPHNYLIQLRLARAMRALRTTENSITDIAYECGFNDGNYFSAAFSRMTGHSPTAYRRLSRNGS